MMGENPLRRAIWIALCPEFASVKCARDRGSVAQRTELPHGGRASHNECGLARVLRLAALFPRSREPCGQLGRDMTPNAAHDRGNAERDGRGLLESKVVGNLGAGIRVNSLLENRNIEMANLGCVRGRADTVLLERRSNSVETSGEEATTEKRQHRCLASERKALTPCRP